MAGKNNASAGSGGRALGIIWLLASIGLAYPAFNLLSSWGLHQGLAGVVVFIGACLLYDIPYRARVRAQHELAMKKTEHWRGRAC